MNEIVEIGGYFELELPHGDEYHKNAIRLNTGRNAFEYVLRAKRYKKVYLPYYTCDVMLEPIKKLNIEYEFYSIDESFYPVFDFSIVENSAVFVYTNYFGLCDELIIKIRLKCKNLVIDNSQAFYSMPLRGIDTFYTARKFFGLSDGAYLYTNKQLNESLVTDISYQRFEQLLGRIDLGAEMFYTVFKKNDDELCNQPIRKMSKLTQRLLKGIDYNTIAETRRQNFIYLHNYLKSVNKLDFKVGIKVVHMIYPLLIENGSRLKQELVKNKIFVATYWPNIINWVATNSIEMNLLNNLVCIPIDQRYNENDMRRILSIIFDYV